jgi:hypothetical protein
MILLDERKFINLELEAQGFGIFDFYDGHQIFDMKTLCDQQLSKRADVLLVDTQTVLNHPELQEQLKIIFNTFLGVIFFHEEKNNKAQSWVEEQAGFLPKIIGEYSLPMPQLQWTLLTNQLQFLWSLLEEQKKLQNHIVKFSQDLDMTLQSAENEMLKAKKLHNLLIPKRADEIKGVSFINKYAVGDGGGGEFYDLLQFGQKVYQVFISSQSYLISSSLVGILNQHKQKDFSPSAFIQDAQNEIQTINSSKKKKSNVEVVVLEMDTSLLSLKAHGWGSLEGYSLNKGKIELGLGSSTATNYQLEKGERVILLSSGFIFNWYEGKINKDIYTFLNNHQQLTQNDLMNEIFLQLSLVKDAEFLTKDASVVMMEVNRHAIHKI